MDALVRRDHAERLVVRRVLDELVALAAHMNAAQACGHGPVTAGRSPDAQPGMRHRPAISPNAWAVTGQCELSSRPR